MNSAQSWPSKFRLAPVIIGAILYLPAMFGSFVWDDHYFVDGTGIGGGEKLANCFTHPFLYHFFRPLVSVSFFFERKVWRHFPAGYHLTNLILFCLTIHFLVSLIRQIGLGERAATIGGLFYAVHPANVGAVAWIGGRTDCLSSLWVVLAGLNLVRFARGSDVANSKFSNLAWGLVFFNLAIYTKEQTLALLPIALAIVFSPRSNRDRHVIKSLISCSLLTASAILFLKIGSLYGLPKPSDIRYTGLEITSHVGQSFAYYTLLLFAPMPKWMHTFSLGAMDRSGTGIIAFGYASLISSVAAILSAIRRNPAIALCMAAALAPLIPVSNALPMPFLMAAPYRSSLSVVGIAICVGYLIEKLFISEFPGHLSFRKFVALVGCLMAGLTCWGAVQWTSELRIFSKFVHHDPDSIVSSNVYGFVLEGRRRHADAVMQREHTLDMVFGSEIWRNGAAAVTLLGRDRVVNRRARQNQGNNDDPRWWVAQLYYNLSVSLESSNRVGDALQVLRAGEQVRDEDPSIQAGIGYCLDVQGDQEGSISRMQRAAWLDQKYAYPRSYLTSIFRKQSRWPEALQAARDWTNCAPANAEAKRAVREIEIELRVRK